MSDPFIGEIKLISFNFPPRGWAFCNGQTLPINQNQALFSILGTTYGGNGTTTFCLPNLQGRMPIHQGNGFVPGAAGGEETHTVTINEMPAHYHPAQANSGAASTGIPTGAVWATGNNTLYSSAPTTTMSPAAMATAGGSQPHENRAPYLVLNYVIALQGIYPSRP